jgi:hypothetical protein
MYIKLVTETSLYCDARSEKYLKKIKIIVIRVITVLNCEQFCQTATHFLLEGKTCCGLKGRNLWTKKMLQYRLASLQPAMNCTMSSALTEAHKHGHKLTCRAITTSILAGALGTILAVTSLSTVLTKCALWTQFTAICAPVSCRHRNTSKCTKWPLITSKKMTHLNNPLPPQPFTGLSPTQPLSPTCQSHEQSFQTKVLYTIPFPVSVLHITPISVSVLHITPIFPIFTQITGLKFNKQWKLWSIKFSNHVTLLQISLRKQWFSTANLSTFLSVLNTSQLHNLAMYTQTY